MHRAITTRTSRVRAPMILSVYPGRRRQAPGRVSVPSMVPRKQVRRAVCASRSFLTCHQRSKFHSSRALISCETLPLPPAGASLLAFASLNDRLCIPHGSRSCRAAEDTVEVIAEPIHALLSGPPTWAIIVMYVFLVAVPCRIPPRFPSWLSLHVQLTNCN